MVPAVFLKPAESAKVREKSGSGGLVLRQGTIAVRIGHSCGSVLLIAGFFGFTFHLVGIFIYILGTLNGTGTGIVLFAGRNQ